MDRVCSKNRRCRAHILAVHLTNDHFRKGPQGHRSHQFWRTCSFCREVPPVPVAAVGLTQSGVQFEEPRRAIRQPLTEISAANENARPRREIRPPRHHDSSPDLDQPWHCERAARDENHPPTFLRDFIDEVDERRRAICNGCRRREREATAVHARRQREDGSIQRH